MAYMASKTSGSTLEKCVIQAAAEIASEHIDETGSVSSERLAQTLQDMMQIDEHVKKHFPGALPGSTTLEKCASAIGKYGLDAENTLYAQSVCPDEINHEEGDVTNLFSTHLGKVFHLGGLAGIPFTGITGFKAFSGHVPDNGHLFILQAPHIGLTASGQFGKYSRDGKEAEDAACGAACGAFAHCCAHNKILHGADLAEDVFDYQMQFIISEIDKVTNVINMKKTENEKQVELVMQTQHIGKNMLDHCVSTDFPGHGHLVVLSGIQINMPRPFEDYFCPLVFELRKRNGEVVNLLPELETTPNKPSNVRRNKSGFFKTSDEKSEAQAQEEEEETKSVAKGKKEKRNLFNIFY